MLTDLDRRTGLTIYKHINYQLSALNLEGTMGHQNWKIWANLPLFFWWKVERNFRLWFSIDQVTVYKHIRFQLPILNLEGTTGPSKVGIFSKMDWIWNYVINSSTIVFDFFLLNHLKELSDYIHVKFQEPRPKGWRDIEQSMRGEENVQEEEKKEDDERKRNFDFRLRI